MMNKKPYTAILCLFLFPALQAQSLYDIETLRSIYLDFENPAWESTLINNWVEGNGERELATVEMDGVTYDSVAVRYKGNATFFWADATDNPKKPLNLDVNDFISGQEILGFNKIKLANSFFDPSTVRDVLGFQIYRDYMPSPEANWMKVYVEGEYLGVYPNTEAINRQFLNRHFDYDNGVLFKCDPASQFGSMVPWASADLSWQGPDSAQYYDRYKLKSESGWAELLELIDVLNNSPEDLESVLNIDRALWYLAVSTVTSNYDSYNGFYMHNYYLYQHENGLFQILPWDVSEIFIGALLGGTVVEGEDIYEWDIFNQDDPFEENRPLVDYVAGHPLYRAQYLAHIRTVIEEVMDETEILGTCQDMQAIISDDLADDDNAFFGLGDIFFEYNVSNDVSLFGGGFEVAGIIPTVENRKAYLLSLGEVSLTPPTISDVEQSIESPQAGEQVAITALIENGTTIDLMISTNEYASHFEAFAMLDDGMHEDGLAGDGVYGAFVPYVNLGDDIKYYIRAQNAEAMMLDPQRAEYEFHHYVVGQTTSLEDINASQRELIVYPNPFSDQFTIQLSNGESTGEVLFEVYSARAELLQRRSVQYVDDQISLRMDDYAAGLYFLRVDGFEPTMILKE